ncbi:MAG: AAA family ATPase [Alphaproteobacteria bacterium]
MDRFVVISGCSGGGKSTLLDALAALGHRVVHEPGRRIVREELASGGRALPWDDPAAFARRAVRLTLRDRAQSAHHAGWVFFDRGLIDAASALQHLTGKFVLERLARRHRCHRTVFLTPPWPEIYVKDDERRHDLADALEEYERLCRIYPSLGYEVQILPKVSVTERVAFVLERLGLP